MKIMLKYLPKHYTWNIKQMYMFHCEKLHSLNNVEKISGAQNT